jgi:hypothetical protein
MKAKRVSISEYTRRIALGLAFLGICCYFVLSWDYAHHLTTSVYDEAAYIYKGYKFATQEYQPYEDFGLWTNHMPLGYLVPGYLQKWFGPGMQTARISSVVLGTLTLLGLGLTAYRLGGVWWGAGVIWAVTFNTGWVKAFSQVFSQGLISFLVAWMLFLIVGKQRNTWELCLAAFLAGLIGMTRVNLFPILFLYLLYLAWSSGRKMTIWAAICGLLPVVWLHIIYWPDVLKLWAYWLPEGIFPGIAQFRTPWQLVHLPEGFSWWPPSVWLNDRGHLAWFGLETLWISIRANFVPFLSVLVSIILWPRDRRWVSKDHRKLSFFLLVVYLSMLMVHLWAALGGNSCQFSCLVGYLIFFNWFGLILAVVVGISWQVRSQTKMQLVVRNIFYLTLGFGVILSPARYFVQGLDTMTCAQNVIASHQGVGVQLQSVIPEGSTVFWDVKSNMLLLYLPEVDVFLPQTSFKFTLVDDPDADWNQLQRFGWWNVELGEEWIRQADFIVVEQRFFDELWEWDQRVARGEFEIILRSMDPESCRAGISNVVVLQPVNPLD